MFYLILFALCISSHVNAQRIDDEALFQDSYERVQKQLQKFEFSRLAALGLIELSTIALSCHILNRVFPSDDSPLSRPIGSVAWWYHVAEVTRNALASCVCAAAASACATAHIKSFFYDYDLTLFIQRHAPIYETLDLLESLFYKQVTGNAEYDALYQEYMHRLHDQTIDIIGYMRSVSSRTDEKDRKYAQMLESGLRDEVYRIRLSAFGEATSDEFEMIRKEIEELCSRFENWEKYMKSHKRISKCLDIYC